MHSDTSVHVHVWAQIPRISFTKLATDFSVEFYQIEVFLIALVQISLRDKIL